MGATLKLPAQHVRHSNEHLNLSSLFEVGPWLHFFIRESVMFEGIARRRLSVKWQN